MSRYLLAIAVCATLTAAASASPGPGLAINAVDSTGAGDRANLAAVKQELAARLTKTSCDGCHVDASITKLATDASGSESSVTAQVDITISDDRGIMVCVLSGGARAVVPSSTLRSARLASLRTEALTAAVDGMTGKVALSLRSSHSSRPHDAWFVMLLHGWFGAPLPTS